MEGSDEAQWLQKFPVVLLKNKVYSHIFKSQCPLLNIAVQKTS